MKLPKAVESYLAQVTASGRSPAYVELDDEGALISAGGALERFGLSECAPGAAMATALPFLAGLLPIRGSLDLPRVSWGRGLVTNVHAFHEGSSAWVVLLDTKQETLEEQSMQQRRNEVSLERDRLRAEAAAASTVLGSLDLVVFAHVEGRRFTLLSDPPTWFARILGRVEGRGAEVSDLEASLLMLESFLPEADRLWAEFAPERPRISSGPWVQTDPAGQEVVLEALALKQTSQSLLCVRRLGDEFTQRRQQLQLARENQLLLDRLRREQDLREVLAHCLVHDLMTPLSAIRGALDLLDDDLTAEQRASMIKTGNEAAAAQEHMIRDVLQVFQAEQGALLPPDPAAAPLLRQAVDSVVGLLSAQSQLERVTLEVDPIDDGLKVLAEPTRLERVLANLLENAVRYSPRQGTVGVRVRTVDAEHVEVSVEDEGPGIDPAQVEGLFEKFGQSGKKRGKAGLGLYFCRMMVQVWGGEIGVEPRPEAGTRFWFRLQVVS